MKRFQPFEAPQRSAGCFKLTEEQAAQLFTPEQLAKGEARFEIETRGPWQLIVSVRGLCVSFDYEADKAANHAQPQPLRIYGPRTLRDWRQTGFEGEGLVSVGGRKRRAFSSSKLFELPGGRLFSAAVLHLGKE